MSNITSELVRQLRERTGSGMMDCKKALVEAQGDLDKAEDILAISSAKRAAKTATRIAGQGIASAAVSADRSSGAIIEVNCETDFVARDSNLKEFMGKIREIILDDSVNTIEALAQASYSDGLTVDQAREGLISKLGENIQLRRLEKVKAPAGGCVAEYVHGDRIAVLIALTKPLETLAKDLAMQVAAMRPTYIDPKEVPESVVNREKAILIERSQDSDKPAHILEKMIEGQLKKYLSELCLVGQPYIKNPDETVESLLKKNDTQVIQMVRFEVGEGIVVEKKSFLEEVEQAKKG